MLSALARGGEAQCKHQANRTPCLDSRHRNYKPSHRFAQSSGLPVQTSYLSAHLSAETSYLGADLGAQSAYFATEYRTLVQDQSPE